MRRANYLGFVFIAVSLILSMRTLHAAPLYQPPQPATDNGRAWLLAHQNSNGSWGTTNSTRDTAVALSALNRLGVSGSAPNAGVAHLAGLAAPDHDTVTRQIVALVGAGFDVSALVTTLLAGQNDALLNPALPNFPEGGWGSASGYATNVLDTLLALDALHAAGQAATAAVTQPAVDYLRAAQHGDGGWGLQVYGDTSNLYLTAHVLLTLQAYSGYVEMGTVTTSAAAWLVSQQQGDGGWGSPTSVYETALAWRALKQLNVTPTDESGALNYLLSRQLGDGSWNSRAYDTAEALLALQDALLLPTPSPTGGPTATATNTRPATRTITPTWTATPLPVPSATPTPLPTYTPTPTYTPSNTPTPLPPAAPTLYDPDNADEDGNYTVSWSTVVDATGYALEEKVGYIGDYAPLYSGPATSVAVTERTATLYCYRVRAVRGAQIGSWSNVVCLLVAPPTNTPTATPAPTNTPTPTPTVNPLSNVILYLGADSNGTVGGITFADEDILAFDTATDSWSLFFDGSDVGATQDINAFHLESDGTLLLSYSVTTLPDVGSIDRSDIVRFTPTSLGETTAGSFSWVLDGSDVELEAISENVDGIGRAPDGRLVISTYGNYDVTGLSGTDSDLLVFNATTFGETSAGGWELYFDGSDVGLTTSGEDIWDFWIDPTTGDLYLNSYLTFSVSGLSGDGDDIFICTPSSLGETTACTFYPFWDGDAHGFNFYVDSMSIGGTVPPISASAQRQLRVEELATLEMTERVFLPLIAR